MGNGLTGTLLFGSHCIDFNESKSTVNLMQSHICEPQVSLFVYGQPMRHVESVTSGNRAHYNYGDI